MYFFLINTETEAVNKLEETTYYQGSHEVKDYLDEFQTLISCTIVVKFRRDLWTAIQSQITTLPVEHPKDINLTVWFEMARCINQARQTNEAFQSNHQIISITLPHILGPPLPSHLGVCLLLPTSTYVLL